MTHSLQCMNLVEKTKPCRLVLSWLRLWLGIIEVPFIQYTYLIKNLLYFWSNSNFWYPDSFEGETSSGGRDYLLLYKKTFPTAVFVLSLHCNDSNIFYFECAGQAYNNDITSLDRWQVLYAVHIMQQNILPYNSKASLSKLWLYLLSWLLISYYCIGCIQEPCACVR